MYVICMSLTTYLKKLFHLMSFKIVKWLIWAWSYTTYSGILKPGIRPSIKIFLSYSITVIVRFSNLTVFVVNDIIIATKITFSTSYRHRCMYYLLINLRLILF